MDLKWIFKIVYFESVGGERIEKFTQQFAKLLGRAIGAEVRTLSPTPIEEYKILVYVFFFVLNIKIGDRASNI